MKKRMYLVMAVGVLWAGGIAAPVSAQTNLALNRPATASSAENAGTAAASAVDGNAGTRWSSAFSDPQWIYVDLGATTAINQVVLTWEAAAAKSYQLQTSNDAATWTTIYTTTTSTGGTQTLAVSGSGRYVRMYGTLRTTQYGYSLWEFAIYGGASATATATRTSTATSTATATTARATATPRATATATTRPRATATATTPVRATATATTVAAGTLLSQARPVTASSLENAGTTANLAVDGNTGTRWSSAASDPQWIYVDLGSVATISRVVLNWEAAYGKAYQVQTSNDAVTWSAMYSTTTGDGGIDDLAVTGSGRYVRMYGTGRATAYGYSLWEFQVYGGGGGATATATATTARATATATTARATATATSTATATRTSTATATVTPTTVSNTNLALNRPATASSQLTAASAAFDGNAGTRWESTQAIDPQWIYVDLGGAAAIGRVVLNWETASAKSYQLQTSNDAVTWTSIYSTTTGPGGIENLTVSGNGRYVRMYGTVRNTAYGYSLWEFEVYGTGGGPTATATSAARATATATSTAAPTPTSGGGGGTSCSTGTIANIALNKPAYSDYYQDAARGPKWAVDGSRVGGANDNRWASAWMPTSWLFVDLGAVATVSRIELYWEAALAVDFDVQTSNDAVTWTTVQAVRGNASQTNVITLPSVKGRYLRLNLITRFTFTGGFQYGYSLYELEIYGCGDNTGVTPTPPPAAPAGTYTLAWSDEFNGTALDTNNWSYDFGPPQNGEAEYYTNADTHNVRVGGGLLTLEAHNTAVSGQTGVGPLTSGRIVTRGHHSWKWGRMTAMMRLPVADGMWPAFWALGNDYGTVGWPNCGEIDVMENIGYGTWFSGALHGPGYNGAGSVGGIINLPAGQTVGAMHEYRADWDPTGIVWYLDGTQVMSHTRSEVETTRGMWVYDHDFYIILNLAMGGDYPRGYNGVTTPYSGLPQSTIDRLPLRADVDYVRVYQKQ